MLLRPLRLLVPKLPTRLAFPCRRRPWYITALFRISLSESLRHFNHQVLCISRRATNRLLLRSCFPTICSSGPRPRHLFSSSPQRANGPLPQEALLRVRTPRCPRHRPYLRLSYRHRCISCRVRCHSRHSQFIYGHYNNLHHHNRCLHYCRSNSLYSSSSTLRGGTHFREMLQPPAWVCRRWRMDAQDRWKADTIQEEPSSCLSRV